MLKNTIYDKLQTNYLSINMIKIIIGQLFEKNINSINFK